MGKHAKTRARYSIAVLVALCACGAHDDPPRLPSASGDLVYDENGRGFECEVREGACVPDAPRGALKAACMDADHSIQLCGCEWVCSGPPVR